MSMTSHWDGSSLGETVALCSTDVSGTEQSPGDRALNLAATNGSRTVSIRNEQLGAFLMAHSASYLICYDVAKWHWRIHDELTQQRNKAAITALWEFSRQFRICDVQLLDQRLRSLFKLVVLPTRSLATIARSRQASVSKDPIKLLSISTAVEAASACFVAHQSMSDEIGLRKIAKTGLLGVGLDVQGAIALAVPSRTYIQMDLQAADAAYQAAEELFRESSQRLWESPQAKFCFEWEVDHSIRRDELGSLQVNSRNLRKWLAYFERRFIDVNGAEFELPRERKRRISSNPRDWGILCRCDRELIAWRDATWTARLMHHLAASFNPSTVVQAARMRIRYDISASAVVSVPAADEWRDLRNPFLRPGPNTVFLICRLNDLELRCLAFIWRKRRHPGGRLSVNFFEDKDCKHPDAAAYVAEIFAREYSPIWPLKPKTYGPFPLPKHPHINWEQLELPALNERELASWRKIAEILLAAVPRGLSASQIVQIFQREVPSRNLGETEVQYLIEWFVEGIFAELDPFRKDRTFQFLARNLGIKDPRFLRKHLNSARDRTFISAEVRKILNGRKNEPTFWKALESLQLSDYLAAQVAEGRRAKALPDLLLHPVRTPLNSIGGFRHGVHVYVAEFLQFADQIRKMVAFKLVSHGYKLVALNEDEFVIEVANEGDLAGQARDKLERLLSNLVARQLNSLGTRCVSASIANRW